MKCDCCTDRKNIESWYTFTVTLCDKHYKKYKDILDVDVRK